MLKATNLLLLVATGLFLAWFLLLRPMSLGGPATYVRVSGISMEPTLSGGDLAVVRKHGSYASGDIVAFRVRGGVVIHRIVDGTAHGFVTQGDNKDAVDPWRSTADDIVGRMWFSVPRAGLLLALLQQPLALAALAGGLATVLVLSGGQDKPPQRPAHRSKKD